MHCNASLPPHAFETDDDHCLSAPLPCVLVTHNCGIPSCLARCLQRSRLVLRSPNMSHKSVASVCHHFHCSMPPLYTAHACCCFGCDLYSFDYSTSSQFMASEVSFSSKLSPRTSSTAGVSCLELRVLQCALSGSPRPGLLLRSPPHCLPLFEIFAHSHARKCSASYAGHSAQCIILCHVDRAARTSLT